MGTRNSSYVPSLRKYTGEQGCWWKPNKNDFAWSILFLKMKHWSLNVIHSCLFLKHTAEGCQISRKSYNPLKCLCKTRVQVKVLHLLAPILNVHWLRSKNCDPPWIKELLTKKTDFLWHFLSMRQLIFFPHLILFCPCSWIASCFSVFNFWTIYFRNAIVFLTNHNNQNTSNMLA